MHRLVANRGSATIANDGQQRTGNFQVFAASMAPESDKDVAKSGAKHQDEIEKTDYQEGGGKTEDEARYVGPVPFVKLTPRSGK